MTDLHEMAENVRRFERAGMDEDGRSGGIAVELETQQARRSSLLEMFGEIFRPYPVERL